MKCQLVGYSNAEFTNKDTGEVTKSVHLHFVRKPKLSENGVQGMVTNHCVVYGENIAKLPALDVGGNYDCDINSYRGKDYLNDCVKL